jgi:hypothetical protein
MLLKLVAHIEKYSRGGENIDVKLSVLRLTHRW